jgi:hypothetical protein
MKKPAHFQDRLLSGLASWCSLGVKPCREIVMLRFAALVAAAFMAGCASEPPESASTTQDRIAAHSAETEAYIACFTKSARDAALAYPNETPADLSMLVKAECGVYRANLQAALVRIYGEYYWMFMERYDDLAEQSIIRMIIRTRGRS